MAISLSFIAAVIPETVVLDYVGSIVASEVAKLQTELEKVANEGLAKVAGISTILAGADSTAVQGVVSAFVASECAALTAEINKLIKEGVDKVYGVTPQASASVVA